MKLVSIPIVTILSLTLALSVKSDEIDCSVGDSFENEILDEKSEFHSPKDLLDEVIALDRNRGKSKPILLNGPKDRARGKNEAGEFEPAACPFPSYAFGDGCCCGAGCCWSKCVWPNAPEECLKGVHDSQWAFNTDKIYWRAVKNLHSQQDCKGENVGGHGNIIPNKCMSSNAKQIPDSSLKVKVWYDAGVLEPKQIRSHENAKKFITATMAHVNHYICSPTLGTVLQTELIDIEYMPEFPFNDIKRKEKREAFLKIMKSDFSGANVHVVFTDYCGGGWAEGIGRLCKDTPIAFNCIMNCLTPKCMSGIVTHEIGHVLGMDHDLNIGCGQDGDKGHMSSTPGRWSTCSKSEFLDNYNLLKSINKWCLAPLPSKQKIECENSSHYQDNCDAWVGLGYCKGQYEKFMSDHCKKSCGGCEKPKDNCNREQAFALKADDVGFAGKCPFPSSKKDSTCCCGDDCCWDKCTLENPPDDCLVGMYNGQWIYDSKQGYYRAVKNFAGSPSVLECSGQLKQKECLVKHYITGPKDVGGKCPSPSYAYGNVCCCGAACCWDKCKWDQPPHDCIEGVPNAKWVKDENNHFVVERN